jgi:hypothetical protein
MNIYTTVHGKDVSKLTKVTTKRVVTRESSAPAAGAVGSRALRLRPSSLAAGSCV